MPIQKIPVKVNFAKGLEQKVDPRQLAFDNFLSLENMVFTKAGLLQKRNGFPNLNNAVAPSSFSYAFNQIPSNMASGNTISPYNDELILDDGMSLYSWAPDSTNWVYKGRAEACQVTQKSVFQNQLNNLVQDSAINSTLGLSVFAWESWSNQPNLLGTLNGVQIAVVDTATGLNVFTANLVSTSSRPRCIAISNKLYVFYFDSADGNLHAQPVTQSGLGAASIILSNINVATPIYDVHVNNNLIYFGYNGALLAAVPRVITESFDASLVSVAGRSEATEIASNGIGIFFDGSNNIWVAYNNSTETKAFIQDSALATSILAPTVVDASSTSTDVHNVTGIFDGTQGIIFYDKPGDLALSQPSAIDTAGNIVDGFMTTASFMQPAVGDPVVVQITAASHFTQVGTVIFIPTGGYYYCSSENAGGGSLTIYNLGLPGNAAPGDTVAASDQIIYPTNGYLDALITYNTLTLAGTVGTPAAFIRSCGLASRAFLQNGFAHVITVHDATIQPTYFVCSLYNVLAPTISAHVLAKISASECGGMPYRSILPSVNIQSSGTYQCALLQRTFLIENTSGGVSHAFWFNGVISGTIDTTVKNLSKVQLGQNLHVGSGTLLMYDGATTVEHNFHLFPENVTFTNTALDGSMSAGVYSYVAVYSWIDNKGQIHRSAPSIPVSLTCAADDSCTILLPTLRVTEKITATIELYRTIANGTIYYRIDTLFIGPGATQYPIDNNTNSNLITIVEGRADYDLTGNQQLYTTGEIENIAAPPVLMMFEYANRIILIPSDNPYSYWFSKQVDPGSPVEFSDFFVKNVGTIGGPLTGGARMDDKIILGKNGILYYVTGVGPAASGANDDFSDPVFITSDAGVKNYQSIVYSPIGILFKSNKGIYLLGRDLSVSYIGAPVEEFNDQEVLSAQLIPTTNELRFIMSGGSSLMYDYYFKQWGQFSNPFGVSDCIYNKLQTYVDSTGTVYQESPGSYVDGASTPVLMSFKTANLNMASISGYERIYDFVFLAQYLSPSQAQFFISYDYLAATDTVTVRPTTSALFQRRIHAKRQLCQSFQVTMNELYAGTPGAGFSMSGITFQLGIKAGVRPIKGASAAGLS